MHNPLVSPRRFRRFVSVIATLCMALQLTGSAQTDKAKSDSELPSAKDVIARFVKAVGGKEAFQKIESQHVKGKYEMPAQGLSGPIEVFAKRPDKLAVKINLAGFGEVLTGYNGEVGWSVNAATGPMLLKDKELEQLREQADFDGVLHEAKNYKSMDTVGTENFEGKECYKLKLVRTSGNESTEFFDTKTGLLVGSITTQESPLGPMVVTSIIDDYRKSSGVLFARKVTQKMGPVEQVMNLTSVKENVVPDSAFEVPNEIKPLLKE